MIVAVITVGVMQVTLDQIIDVVAVGNRFMSTSRSMSMGTIMPCTPVLRRTIGRIGAVDV